MPPSHDAYQEWGPERIKQGADQVLNEGIQATTTASITHINIRGADYYQ